MQDQNNLITYPSRIWDDGKKSFVPNLADKGISSDQLTTVAVKDTNEVLGFQDGTPIDVMERAINGDLHGTISEHKPSFYEKHIQQPLADLGMDAFQPKFITDIKPTPERAFVTSFARGATADIVKPLFSEQEAQAFPAQAFAGGLAGTVAAFGSIIGPAVDSLFASKAAVEGGEAVNKLSGMTQFSENIIKQGLSGGVYRGIYESANQLRDSEHPDLAKIGTGVLHDTLWWGAIGGIAGEMPKSTQATANAGLMYLMAKSDGASEPDALLNAGVGFGFGLLHHYGDRPEVRQLVMDHTARMVADYVQAKNPLVDEQVALQTGREKVDDYADQIVEKANEDIAKLPFKEPVISYINGEKFIHIEGQDIPSGTESIMSMIKNKEDIDKQRELFGTPGKYKDPYDPKMMNYLSRFIPPYAIARMDGIERLRLGNSPMKDLVALAESHALTAREMALEEEQGLVPNPFTGRRRIDVENEAKARRGIPAPSAEVVSSKELSKQMVMQIGNDLSQGGENAKGAGGKTQQGSEQAQGLEQGTQTGVHLRDNEKNGMEAKSGKKVENPNLKEVATDGEAKIAKASKDINASAVKKGFEELSPEEQAQFNPISKKETLQKLTDLLEKNPEGAKRMASGEEKFPEDIPPQAGFNAVKNKAIEEGDIETIRNLALSPLAKERSLAAQTLSAASFDNGVVHDPVKIIQEVQKAIGKDKVYAKETKEIVKKLKNAVKESAPKQSDWDKFISELAC